MREQSLKLITKLLKLIMNTEYNAKINNKILDIEFCILQSHAH